MTDEQNVEEALLRRALDHSRRRTAALEAELLSDRFGWTRIGPPSSGIIETHGFTYWPPTHSTRQTVGPGRVNAAEIRVPHGTLWRPAE